MSSLFDRIPEHIRRPSIRSRLSALLLLSTLNTVAIGSGAFVLYNAIADSPTRERVRIAHGARAQVDQVQARLLDSALKGTPADVFGVAASLTAVREELEATEIWTDDVAADWRAWDSAARAISGGPGIPEDHSDQQIGLLRLSHGHLTGRLLLAGDYTRPDWVEDVAPIMPWATAWIGLIGVLTVAMAYSLEVLLSRPLAGLADAAERVGGGDLSQAIDVHDSVPEVERVASAIAGMRDRLVHMIGDAARQNQEMSTILGNLSDGVLLTDRVGRILELNRAAQRLLAPPARSRVVEGRLLTSSEHPPAEGGSIEAWLPELRQVPIAAHVHDIEVIREANGAKRWLLVAVSAVPLGRVVVVRDVSNEREIENIKRDFLSVITHELKTPLTPIEGYARLLQLGKGGPLTDKQKEYVAIIHTQAGILKAMVQNLLDATRIEGGQLPIHPQELDLSAFLDQVGNTWRGNTETKGIAFELRNLIPRGTLANVDPFRLEQVVGNLMSNAAKFTPSGGRITLGGSVADGKVSLTVQDTGRGIPPDSLLRIFERFYQVEQGDKRASGGAGLGLYIVKQLVEAMAGTVSVESEPGEGSRFWIEFPQTGGATAPTVGESV